MRHFPLFVNLEDQPVFVVGHGGHTRQKIEKLLPYRPRLTWFDGEALDGVTVLDRPPTEADLDAGPALVLVTDRDPALQQQIYTWCIDRRIPVNVEDVPRLCSFYFPALITRGPLTVGISTSGQGPAAATLLRERFDPQVPDRMEEILDQMADLRTALAQTIPDFPTRRRLLRQLMEQAMERDRPLTAEEVAAILP